MSAEAYLICSCAAVAALLVYGLRRAPAPAKAGPQPDPGRWRRFRVHEEPLRGVLASAATAALEEPSGLRLDAAPRATATDPVRLAGPGGLPAVTIRRGWLFEGKFRVKIGGRPALELVTRRGAIAVRGLGGEAIEARGDVRSGKYEIRRGGRLVALSFRDGPAGGASGPAVRRLEVLREEDPVLPLALAMALEVAARS